MEIVYLTKITVMGTSHGIVIPANILRGLKWERGDVLCFGFSQGDQLWLKKVPPEKLRELKPDIAY